MVPHRDELFRFGTVTGTHGLRGDLKVRPLTADSVSLQNASEVFLGRPGEEPLAYVPVRMSPHKGFVLLRLEGREAIGDVEEFVGCDVLMRFDELSDPAEESEFYWFQLEGIEVLDERRGELGRLEEVFTTAAHDIFVVRGGLGEVLIPAVDEFVLEIDREARRMRVDLPDGLVPGDEP